MTKHTNRRRFITTTAAASVGFWAAGGVTPKQSLSANETINFASIGVEGKGHSDSNDAGRSGNMVAICDIDDRRLGKAAGRFPKAKTFFDYREMIEKMGKTIDAVTVSTPDHSHAPASVMAMRMGKHCFTQKPMTHSIYEARLMATIAKEKKLATMMGNQGTALASLRKMAAIIQSGCLGKITEVHVWTNRPVWPQGSGRPKETPNVPAHVHWDEFIGPAKFRPYHPAYHPFKWRGWWAFGTGALGDMACHTLNMPFAALDLRDPTSVVAKTSGHNKETYPKWSIIDYAFPKRGKRPALTMRWYDGGKLPAQELFNGAQRDSSGAIVVGEKGSLYAPGDYAQKGYKISGDVEEPEVTFEKSPGHFQEWVRAIKGGKPAMSNFVTYAGPLSETVLLGNLAVWADGKKIEWDAKNLKAKNAPEVQHIVKHEYRKGWKL